jgi:predicted phosphodiesterase
VQEDNTPRRSVALIGNLAGDNAALESILEHIQVCDVEAILCLGNLTGDSPFNRNLIKTIRRKKILALQGETDWQYSQSSEQPDMPNIDPRMRDWLFQLPQILSFKLNTRKSIAFFGDYIQSFADYSDFEPFALEMNMVCGLTDFMRDETVFPALAAMIPQFQADIIIYSQVKTWGICHIDGKDFISVGAAASEFGLTWGLLEENIGRADLKIMKVEQ